MRKASWALALALAAALVVALPVAAYAGTFKVTGIASGDYNPGATATMKGRLWYSSNGGKTWVAAAGKRVSLTYGPAARPVVEKSTVSTTGGYFTLTRVVGYKNFKRDIRIAMAPSNPPGSLVLTPKFYVRLYPAGKLPQYMQLKQANHSAGILLGNGRDMGASLATASQLSMSRGGYFMWFGPSGQVCNDLMTGPGTARPHAVYIQKWHGGTSWGAVRSGANPEGFPWQEFAPLDTSYANTYYRVRHVYAGSRDMGKNAGSSTAWGYVRFLP